MNGERLRQLLKYDGKRKRRFRWPRHRADNQIAVTPKSAPLA